MGVRTVGSIEGITAVGLSCIGGAIAAIVIAAPSQAATLENWQFDPDTHQLVITVPKGVSPNYYLVAEPARIVVDLPNTEVGIVPMQQSFAGAVRAVRVAQFQAGLTRIVLELSPDAVLAPGQVELQQLESPNGTTDRWAVRPLLVAAEPNPTVADPTIAESTPVPTDPSPTDPSPTAAPPTDLATTATPPSPTEPNQANTSEADTNETALANQEALPPLEPGAVEIPIEPPTASADAPEPLAEPLAAAREQSMPAPDADASLAVEALENEPEQEPEAASADVTQPEPVPEQEPEAVTPEAVTPEAVTPELTRPEPARPIAETPSAVPTRRAPAPVPTSPSSPITTVSPPLPVDFSSPPAALSEPTLPTGTASALSLPVGSSAVLTPTPARTVPSPAGTTASDSLSFPTPTAESVAVPSIDTVADQAEAETPLATHSPRATSRAPQPASVRPASTAATPANSTPASPQRLPTQTAVVSTPAEPIPFGQPISGQASPSPSARPTIPFGQALSPVQPNAAVKPEVEVIVFGQPLPPSQPAVRAR